MKPHRLMPAVLAALFLALPAYASATTNPGTSTDPATTTTDTTTDPSTGFCPAIDLDPSTPDPASCADLPHFKASFQNRVWRFRGEVNDSSLDTTPQTIGFTLSKIDNLPRKFQRQDDPIIDQDTTALLSAKTRVYGPDGRRIAAAMIDSAAAVRVDGKLLPPAKWVVDEDGYAVPTVRARKVVISSFELVDQAPSADQPSGDQSDDEQDDQGDNNAGGDQGQGSPAAASDYWFFAGRVVGLHAATRQVTLLVYTEDGPDKDVTGKELTFTLPSEGATYLIDDRNGDGQRSISDLRIGDQAGLEVYAGQPLNEYSVISSVALKVWSY